MKNSYQVRAQKFIRQIAPFLERCNNTTDYEYAVYAYNNMFHRHVRYAHGLTRIALITSDYVVKIEYGNLVTVYGGCEEELSLYKEAEEEGFAYILAKIDYFHYNGRDYYIMPRINSIGRTDEDADEYMTESEKDWCNSHRLCDLHNGNYGWKNNHVILIDYAARY